MLTVFCLALPGVAYAGENTKITGIIERDFIFSDDKTEFESNVTTVELSKDELFEKFIWDEILSAKNDFIGPGHEMDSCEIEVFNLIQNSDISDPKYLEREKGINVKISYNGNGMNKLQKTLWGYEYDATIIYKIFFNSDYEKDIGFILISFKDQDGFVEEIKFKMTAADSKQFVGNPDDGLYINQNLWSSVDINSGSQISMYEDPDTIVIPANRVLVNDGSLFMKITTDQEFLDYIKKKNDSLNLLSQKIISACLDDDWVSASEISDDMIIFSDSVKDEASKMILSEKSAAVREKYLESVDSYHRAAMYLWYGTTFWDREKIENGMDMLKLGIFAVNSLYDSADIEYVEESRVIISPAVEMIPDALKITDVYRYQDINKENDISIRIEDFGYRNLLWLKDGDDQKRLTSEYGKKYLYIVVDVTHLGFRGGNTQEIYTPEKADFTLMYLGDEIKDETPALYISSLGMPYNKVKLSRREHFEAVMLFSVPEDFNEKDAYVKVELEGGKSPVWCFDFPENISIDK